VRAEQRGATCTSDGQCASNVCSSTCEGDCDWNGHVTVDELVQGVDITLGTEALDQCSAFDCNGTEAVTVDCLVKAVNNALMGCLRRCADSE